MFNLILILGLLSTACGVFVVGFGVPIRETTFGSALLVAGAVAIAGGFVTIGLAAVVSELRRVIAALKARLAAVPRPLRPVESKGGPEKTARSPANADSGTTKRRDSGAGFIGTADATDAGAPAGAIDTISTAGAADAELPRGCKNPGGISRYGTPRPIQARPGTFCYGTSGRSTPGSAPKRAASRYASPEQSRVAAPCLCGDFDSSAGPGRQFRRGCGRSTIHQRLAADIPAARDQIYRSIRGRAAQFSPAGCRWRDQHV